MNFKCFSQPIYVVNFPDNISFRVYLSMLNRGTKSTDSQNENYKTIKCPASSRLGGNKLHDNAPSVVARFPVSKLWRASNGSNQNASLALSHK